MEKNCLITKCIAPGNLDFYSAANPVQSVYLDFVRKNPGEILELGEFEALRRWILTAPAVMPIPVHPADSHRITREFYRQLRKEQKQR